jgi:hypothetical protein
MGRIAGILRHGFGTIHKGAGFDGLPLQNNAALQQIPDARRVVHARQLHEQFVPAGSVRLDGASERP